ncbi:MAG: hypothetical protein IT379_41925 [Deltaproteobacteria bacterium]|nr:hypothetical protein [Deltaproteobacteria bacterium]
MSERCRHHTLARGPLAHVQQCASCGCVSVHLGATTVRMDAGALQSIARVLADASTRLTTTQWSHAPPGDA